MDVIVQLISNMGFPIAMCIMLVWYINNTMKSVNSTLQSLQRTVENNTMVVEKLNNRMDRLEGEENDKHSK